MAVNPFEINRTARPAPNVGRNLDIARSKREFFGNNPGVSDDRALRRITQFDKDIAFKNKFTRPVQGSSNLLQMTADAPRSLAAERMRLANVYGPTPREIMGDMGRGIGSMFQGLAEKGTPMMNLAKGLYSGVQNFLSPMNPMPSINTGIENLQSGFNNFMQSGQNFNMLLASLNPQQRMVYDQEIMVPGTTREDAYRKAKGIQRMAMGGISSLN
tara:strand:+ start:235 stop:879 length:645 start_codon:yes stop_codon:yes gene_type:complete